MPGEGPEELTFFEDVTMSPGPDGFFKYGPSRVYFVPSALDPTPTPGEISAGQSLVFRLTRDAAFTFQTGRSPINREPFGGFEVFPLVARAERFLDRAEVEGRAWWRGHVTGAWDHLRHGECDDDGSDW